MLIRSRIKESRDSKGKSMQIEKEKKSRNPNPNPNPKRKKGAGLYLGLTTGSTAGHRPRGSSTEGRLAGTDRRRRSWTRVASPRAGSERAPPPSRSTAACSHTGEHARRRGGRRRRRGFFPWLHGCRRFVEREDREGK